MTTAEALQWVNLTAFVVLGVGGVKLLQRRQLRGYGMVLIAWAVNDIAFYIAVIWLREWFTSGQLNEWSAITKLQAVIMALGLARMAWTRGR